MIVKPKQIDFDNTSIRSLDSSSLIQDETLLGNNNNKQFSKMFENFILETNEICNEMQDEIDKLRNRLKNKKFENLDITINNTVQIINDPALDLYAKVDELSRRTPSPDITQMMNVYNEKIAELFMTLAETQSQLSEKDYLIRDLSLQLGKLGSDLAEKDFTLSNIHSKTLLKKMFIMINFRSFLTLMMRLERI